MDQINGQSLDTQKNAKYELGRRKYFVGPNTEDEKVIFQCNSLSRVVGV
jgi:hypothetical protein